MSCRDANSVKYNSRLQLPDFRLLTIYDGDKTVARRSNSSL